MLDRGLRPVARNYRCRGGEIDLIMLDRKCLVFIEVRYRRSAAFTAAALSVDGRKQSKLVRTAALFLSRNPVYGNLPARFDVVAIEGERAASLHWIRDAFRPNDSTL